MTGTGEPAVPDVLGPVGREVLMWEAVAVSGSADRLVAWAREHAGADALLFCSADDRVVVLGGAALPEPPAALVRRPPHAWPFRRV